VLAPHPLSRKAKGSRFRQVSWLSLADAIFRSVFRRRAFPIQESVAIADGFESITVAGPRGNHTRFPILPDQNSGHPKLIALV